MARVIFHIDINAYFASAHLITDESLAGKPLVVCSNHRGSVVTTASYEARAFGISSAMPLSHAKRLCPDLVVVDLDFELYSELSEKFINIVKSFAPLVQQASIDECYVDVSELIFEYEKPLDLAIEIQKKLLNELKLPVSIGVAPNKFLAKMASDMVKPKGITILRIRDVEEKLWHLDIDEMHGIGKKTVPKLRDLGINTIGDLAKQDHDRMRPILGMSADAFINKAKGLDQSPMDYDSVRKSLGQSRTFQTPMYELDEIRHAIRTEINEVERRLKGSDLVGRTIQFAIRLEDFKTAVRSITIENYTDRGDVMFEHVMQMYDEFDGLAGVTFISVTMSNLVYKDEMVEQLNIFEDLKEPTVKEILNRLNESMNGAVFLTPRQLLEKNKS